MELMDYSFRIEPIGGLHRITLNCIGNDNDIVTIRKVFNTGVWQGIGLSRPLDRAKEEMKAYILGTNNEKENKTMTATEQGYSRGMETAIRAARSTYGFAWNNKDLKIKKVIFNDPATIVFWADGTKTVAKAHGDDKFDKEVGLTVCIAKKALGNRSNFDKVFKKWIK